jgi:putative FmdB family regulatory protein
MPVYEVECKECKEITTRDCPVADRKDPCPKCKGEVTVLLGTPGFSWKGGPPTPKSFM